MTVVNELWSNHSGSAKHRRRPNDTLRHNTLIKAHLESESASPVSLRAALARWCTSARKTTSCTTVLVRLLYFFFFFFFFTRLFRYKEFASLALPPTKCMNAARTVTSRTHASGSTSLATSECCPKVKQFGNNCTFQHCWLHPGNFLEASVAEKHQAQTAATNNDDNVI